MVDRPRPVELGPESLSVCVDVLYALVPPVILTGLDNEDGHRGIFGETSCDSDARETAANDYIVKGLESGIPWIPRYAVCAFSEWSGGICLGGKGKRGRAEENGRGDDDEAGAHRVQKEGQGEGRRRREVSNGMGARALAVVKPNTSDFMS
jgi:hypothetical protein